MSQNYQYLPKFCDLSVKIAPDLKKKFGFRYKKIQLKIGRHLVTVKISNFLKKWGSLGGSVKIYGVFG